MYKIGDIVNRIGVDEAGKGDYFGYLVVAAVYITSSSEKELKGLGVKDSKRLTDYSVKKLGPKIKKICKTEIVKISPEKYNKIYPKFGSLNKLLAWGHARAIENVIEKSGCKNVITDKFADESVLKEYLMEKGRKAKVIQKVHAESDMAVAAASVLARYEFLRTLRILGREIGFVLPKGATHVKQTAKDIVKKHGKNALSFVAKLHFKTTKEIIKD
jgi:ribonuclease HIII